MDKDCISESTPSTPFCRTNDEGFETGDKDYVNPPPLLRVKVQLPHRQSLLDNGVDQLELVLNYGDIEEQVLKINICGDTELATTRTKIPQEIVMRREEVTRPAMDLILPTPPNSDHGQGQDTSTTDLWPQENIPYPSKRLPPNLIPILSRLDFSKKLPHQRDHPFVFHDPMKKVSNKDPSQWPQCYFCSKRYQNMDLHLLTHTQEKPYPCQLCGDQFTRGALLKAHIQRYHAPGRASLTYQCNQCGKSFHKKLNLGVHMRHQHNVVAKKSIFKCSRCPKRFTTKMGMSIHLKSIHLKIRHPCPHSTCGRSYSNLASLRLHQRQWQHFD